ncbi:MAG: ABC transporter permease [Acidobacteriales bacterium]|nr:ABC transporter permease [Terriglobales bacterium]
MSTLIQDLRYGARMLLKKPGFTLIAVITLALGIGANTAIFSLIDALLLRPLPGVEAPERLVMVYTSDFSSGRYSTSSFPDYKDFRDQNQVFSGLAAFANNQAMHLSTGGESERIRGGLVTGNYFSVLGVQAKLGRVLLPEDDQTLGAHPVAVLSHDLWQRRFGGDQSVIGKTVSLNGYTFTLVGVAPEGFRGTGLQTALELWVPILMYRQINPAPGQAPPAAGQTPFDRRGSRGFFLVGRLKPESTLEQAQAQFNVLAARLALTYPQTNLGTLQQPDQPRPITLVPINQAMVGPVTRESTRRVTQLLMAVVGFVLLIACANIANLLLAQARGRQREIAVRLALGASRFRIIRQMLVESALLALVGGAASMLLALWLADLLLSFEMFAAFAALDLKLDARVLGFTTVVSLLTGVIFGLAPALQASKPELVSALKDSESGDRLVPRRSGLRNVLVAAQVALSLVLLVGAGLFARSLQKAYATDLGFETGNALLASVDMARQGYTEAQGRQFYRQLMERIEALPGVRAATLAQYIPIDANGSRTGVSIEGYTQRPNEDLELSLNIVGSGYFQALGIPLVLGRGFSEQDTDARVVIINETMARRFWTDQNPLGRRISTSGSNGPFYEVIGVAGTGKYRNLREEALPYFYLPLSQQYRPRITLFVRTSGSVASVQSSVRAAVKAIDQNLPLFEVKTFDEHLARALAPERTNAALIGSFALLALLLAAVGIYGTVSYSVAQRTHEIGIRMALGAQRIDVLNLIVWQGMRFVLIGVAVGLSGALALTRLIASFLYGVSATDLLTFAVIASSLSVVALLACYLPARRATKVDPVIALRYE